MVFIEALQKHGLINGFVLGLKRILKCHPFKSLGGGHGLDLVPVFNNVTRRNKIKGQRGK